MEEKTRLKDI